jgi:hypothetical protein
MNEQEKRSLRDGDIVRQLSNGEAYMVVVRFGHNVIVGRTVELTNPAEWELVAKSKLEYPEPFLEDRDD